MEAREGCDAALDLGRVTNVDRAHLHAERRRHGLDDGELADPGGNGGSQRIAARVTSGAISLSSSSHFPLRLYSNWIKPVALPPGRARLSTKPEPTGSGTITNTIGTVRVACSSGARPKGPPGYDDVRRKRDQFRSIFARVGGIAPHHSGRRCDVAAVGPAQLRQPLQECRDAGLRFRIVHPELRCPLYPRGHRDWAAISGYPFAFCVNRTKYCKTLIW